MNSTKLTVSGGTVGGTSPNATLTVSGGSGSITVEDAYGNSVGSVSTYTVDGAVVSGSAGSATSDPAQYDKEVTSSCAVNGGDMAGSVALNATSGTQTLTLSAQTTTGSGCLGVAGTLGSWAAGTGIFSIVNTGTVSWALTNSSGLTLNGIGTGAAAIPPGTQGTFVTNSAGTAIDFFGAVPVQAANPTGTAGPAAVNGSATTFMRSDAAPLVQKASSSQFGIVEVDNTTITASSGVISAVTPAVSTQNAISGTGNTFSGTSGFAICSSSCTITPPVPAAGSQFCVWNGNDASGVITLGALGSSAYYQNTARTAYGTAGTGTLSSGGATGDLVCIVGVDSTHYNTVSYSGTWTAS